tara:strand:+ start:143 stop:394 length:252 start_codon:yes stop_codon:yes gene_type:complete
MSLKKRNFATYGIVEATLSEETKALHNRTINENALLNLDWFHKLPDNGKLALVMRIKPFHYSAIVHEDLIEVYENEIKDYLKK